MPRINQIPNSMFPYHITSKSNNGEIFPVPLNTVWSIMCDELWLTHLKYNLLIHSFVLMPNHFHLYASTPNANLSQAMNYFLTQIAKQLNFASNRINSIHGSRFHRCLVTTDHYFCHVYKYIYRNPVRANLAKSVEDYPYSTIQMFLGSQKINLPITKDDLLMHDIDNTLLWLNKETTDFDWRDVQKALRRGIFTLNLNKLTRERSHLEYNRF